MTQEHERKFDDEQSLPGVQKHTRPDPPGPKRPSWPKLLRIVTIAALLSFIVELILVQTSYSVVQYFPPLFPYLITLTLLTTTAIIWGGPGWLRRTTATLAAIALIGIAGFTYVFFGITSTRGAHVCNWTYRLIPELVHPAPSVGLPEDLLARPEIEISWPGEYTCIWPPDPGEATGATYSTPLLASTPILKSVWS